MALANAVSLRFVSNAGFEGAHFFIDNVGDDIWIDLRRNVVNEIRRKFRYLQNTLSISSSDPGATWNLGLGGATWALVIQ